MYTERYTNFLGGLNPRLVYSQICALYEGVSPAEITLLCYEPKNYPCHRHLVAKWLSNNGIPTTEAAL